MMILAEVTPISEVLADKARSLIGVEEVVLGGRLPRASRLPSMDQIKVWSVKIHTERGQDLMRIPEAMVRQGRAKADTLVRVRHR
jgi:hypothetical protein